MTGLLLINVAKQLNYYHMKYHKGVRDKREKRFAATVIIFFTYNYRIASDCPPLKLSVLMLPLFRILIEAVLHLSPLQISDTNLVE